MLMAKQADLGEELHNLLTPSHTGKYQMDVCIILVLPMNTNAVIDVITRRVWQPNCLFLSQYSLEIHIFSSLIDASGLTKKIQQLLCYHENEQIPMFNASAESSQHSHKQLAV